MARWEMKIGFGQVVLLWILIAFVMLLVFWFGFRAGMNQGLLVAMEETGEQLVRLPIVQPVAVADTSGEGSKVKHRFSDLPELSQESNATEKKLLAEGTDEPTKLQGESGPVFDFSAISDPPKASPPPSETSDSNSAQINSNNKKGTAGFSSKRTKDLLSKQAPLAVDSLASTNVRKPEKKEISTKKDTKKNKPSAQLLKPAVVITPVKKGLSPGWYVQVAATRSQAEANSTIKRFSSLKLRSLIERAKVAGRVYYRILLGPYDTRAKALSAKDRIKQARVVKDEPFLKQVK